MLWKKLFTAARGAGNEVGEAMVDAQAFRILDQELRDASAALARSIRELSGIVAIQKAEQRRIADLKDRIEADEAAARDALTRGEEGLATEIAERILDRRERLTSHELTCTALDGQIRQMRAAVVETDGRINDLRRDLVIARSTAELHRAKDLVAAPHVGGESPVTTATATLSRIKKIQQGHADRMAAARELSEEMDGGDLDRRLQDKGLVPSRRQAVEDVLAGLRAPGGPPSSAFSRAASRSADTMRR
jgi:phage shock protein A